MFPFIVSYPRTWKWKLHHLPFDGQTPTALTAVSEMLCAFCFTATTLQRVFLIRQLQRNPLSGSVYLFVGVYVLFPNIKHYLKQLCLNAISIGSNVFLRTRYAHPPSVLGALVLQHVLPCSRDECGEILYIVQFVRVFIPSYPSHRGQTQCPINDGVDARPGGCRVD